MDSIIFDKLEELASAITVLSPERIGVEIGCGSGHFTVQVALNKRDFLIIGCDLKKDRLEKTLKKVKNNELNNVLLYRGKGEELISFFPDESISELYVNFPDPWPKRRHMKRRFFNKSIVELIYNKLKHQGILYFVTDHEQYFFDVIEVFKESRFVPVFENYFTINLDGYYSTLYMEKFKKEGKNIYFSFMKKI